MKKLFGFAMVIMTASLSFAQNIESVDLDAGAKLYQKSCASCHGTVGVPTISAFPKLAGQSVNYLHKQLLDYQQGRVSPVMTPLAKALSSQDIENLVIYIHSFKPNYGVANPALVSRGELLYRRGDSAKAIPACSACHSPEGLGNNQAKFPVLAGQNAAYIVQQLQVFASQNRSNDPNGMMRSIAIRLSPQDQQAVASYINGLQPRH